MSHGREKLFAAIRIGESTAPGGRFDYGRIERLRVPRAVITAGRAAGTYACPVASKVRVHL
ncbi:MAG: hypothetical protein WBF20_25960 [Trebonia sp.]|uniref:hypothetical protein n=1 Tax=Trebonia sp. TaxID=2767075 RepID=UPI003BAF32C9